MKKILIKFLVLGLVLAPGLIAGADYRKGPSVLHRGTVKGLTMKDHAHGREQLDIMLGDLPGMREYLTKGSLLWSWTVRQFAGEASSFRVDWDMGVCPRAEACHAPPYEPEGNGKISVTPHWKSALGKREQLKSGSALWSQLVFEFFNMRRPDEFKQIYEKTRGGEVSQLSYIIQHYLTEYQAYDGVRKFYNEIFKPLCENLGLQCSPNDWHANYDRSTKEQNIKWMMEVKESPDRWTIHEKNKHYDLYYKSAEYDSGWEPTRKKRRRSKQAENKVDRSVLRRGVIKQLSQEDRAHGRAQLEKMLADCPQLNRYVMEKDSLWEWILRQFAGEATPFRIDWDLSICLAKKVDSLNLGAASQNEPGKMAVSPKWISGEKQGQLKNSNYLWAQVVALFYKIRRHQRYLKVETDAANGEVSELTYALQKAVIKHETAAEMSEFYFRVFKPLAKRRWLEISPYEWLAFGERETIGSCVRGVFEKFTDKEHRAIDLYNKALVYEKNGTSKKALKHFRKAYQAYEKAGMESEWKEKALKRIEKLGGE